MNLSCRCNICNNVMIRSYFTYFIKGKKQEKSLLSCITHTHRVSYYTDEKDNIEYISLYLSSEKLFIHWDLINKELFSSKNQMTFQSLRLRGGELTYLPYFEYDLFEYKRLIKKIGTYLLFV